MSLSVITKTVFSFFYGFGGDDVGIQSDDAFDDDIAHFHRRFNRNILQRLHGIMTGRRRYFFETIGSVVVSVLKGLSISLSAYVLPLGQKLPLTLTSPLIF